MLKAKKVLLYHAHVNGADDLGQILAKIGSLPQERRIVDFGDVKIVLDLKPIDGSWIITLQELKSGELPKVANSQDGSDEIPLNIPDGKALSSKNVFVFDQDKNILGSIRLYGCQQMGRLRSCLEKIAYLTGSDKVEIKFTVVFEKGLAMKLANAKEITTATFTSLDYDGSEIDEGRLSAYKEYLSGKGFQRKTIISGKRRCDNIKAVVQPIIDDFLSYGDAPVDIEMKVDGENINFQRYYKTYSVSVQIDDQRFINYDDLTCKVCKVVESYSPDDHE